MYVMAQLGRMEEIQRLSIYVSDYLRGILPSGMRFVRLDEELQLVDNYLEIQKIMRGTKFEYRILVRSHIEILKFRRYRYRHLWKTA